MSKAVNIPALQDHNSLKALGGDHTGKCEAHCNPFFPYITDPNHTEAFFLQSGHLAVFRQHIISNLMSSVPASYM